MTSADPFSSWGSWEESVSGRSCQGCTQLGSHRGYGHTGRALAPTKQEALRVPRSMPMINIIETSMTDLALKSDRVPGSTAKGSLWCLFHLPLSEETKYHMSTTAVCPQLQPGCMLT